MSNKNTRPDVPLTRASKRQKMQNGLPDPLHQEQGSAVAQGAPSDAAVPLVGPAAQPESAAVPAAGVVDAPLAGTDGRPETRAVDDVVGLQAAGNTAVELVAVEEPRGMEPPHGYNRFGDLGSIETDENAHVPSLVPLPLAVGRTPFGELPVPGPVNTALNPDVVPFHGTADVNRSAVTTVGAAPTAAGPVPNAAVAVHAIPAPAVSVVAAPTTAGPAAVPAVPAPPAVPAVPAPPAMPAAPAVPVAVPAPPAMPAAPAVPVAVPAPPAAVPAAVLAAAVPAPAAVVEAQPAPIAQPPPAGNGVGLIPGPDGTVIMPPPPPPAPVVYTGVDYVPSEIRTRMSNIARYREVGNNRYALAAVPRSADWGRTPRTEKILCLNNKPLFIWVLGRVRSLWFFDRTGDPHLRVNIGVTLHSDADRCAAKDWYGKARPRPDDVPSVVYAGRICGQQAKGEYVQTATAFSQVYDATARLRAKSAMPQLSPVDLGKNDIVVIECQLTRWRRASDGKAKKTWTSYDVGFELHSIFQLYSAPSDIDDQEQTEAAEEITAEL